MRYAAAVIAVDKGDLGRARAILEEAPKWPAGSAFRAFQAELGAMVGMGPRESGPASVT